MANASPWRVIDVIDWGKKYFADKGIETPRLTIELLLCHVLGCRRIDLYTDFERLLADSQLAELKICVKRRASREPLQYITGTVQFMGLEFSLKPGVLIPRPETEQMVSKIVDTYKDTLPPQRILDIGCGSGCIAVSLAKAFPGAEVIGIDNSQLAVEISVKNAANNDAGNSRFQLHDILKKPDLVPYIDSKRYDLVVSNPPYIDKAEHDLLDPEVRIYEPAEALTDNDDGLTFYRHYAKVFSSILTDDGTFYLEIGWGQKRAVTDIFMKSGIEATVIDDFGGVPRFLTNSHRFPEKLTSNLY